MNISEQESAGETAGQETKGQNLNPETVTIHQVKELMKKEQGETFIGFLLLNLCDCLRERSETKKNDRHYFCVDMRVRDWVRVYNATQFRPEQPTPAAGKEAATAQPARGDENPDIDQIEHLYADWCKETKRSGGVLIGKSIHEFFQYAVRECEIKEVATQLAAPPAPVSGDRCQCGHLRSEHYETTNDQYMSGRCSIGECRCASFVKPASAPVEVKGEEDRSNAIKSLDDRYEAKDINNLTVRNKWLTAQLAAANEKIKQQEDLVTYWRRQNQDINEDLTAANARISELEQQWVSVKDRCRFRAKRADKEDMWVEGYVVPRSLFEDPHYLEPFWIATGCENEAFPIYADTITPLPSPPSTE